MKYISIHLLPYQLKISTPPKDVNPSMEGWPVGAWIRAKVTTPVSYIVKGLRLKDLKAE
jgi:hypothetical protein